MSYHTAGVQEQKCWADLLVVVLALFVGLVNDPHSRIGEQPGPLLLLGEGLLPGLLALAAAVLLVPLSVALPSITFSKEGGGVRPNAEDCERDSACVCVCVC